VLELVFAIALTGLVLGAAFGVFGMLRATDEVTREASSDAVSLAFAQAVIRNAMSDLQAATPISAEEAESLGLTDDPAAEGLAGVPPELRERIESMTAGQLEGASEGVDERLGRMVATADMSEPPFFELWYEEVEGVTLPRLRVVVSTPPNEFRRGGASRDLFDDERSRRRALAARWSGKIRGVFELRWAGRRGWSLVWRPEEPAGEPVALIDGLRALRWEVLLPPLDEDGEPVPLSERADAPAVWEEVHAAYLQRDFPDAVRLIMETRVGTRIDWLFETSVLTPGGGQGRSGR
jgi:hypothetical protein